MIVVSLALASAMIYGAADFCGGTATRRSTAFSVLMVSLPVGMALLIPLTLAVGGSCSWQGMLWGVASGSVGGVGLIVFYSALASGPMSVVAPISGLVAAVIPVIAGILRGDRLGVLAMGGILLCLVAVTFVSMEPSSGRRAMSVRDLLVGGPMRAVISGLGFGIFFVLLRMSGDGGSLWPLVGSKTAGMAVTIACALITTRGSLPFPRDAATIKIAAIAGVLDVMANALYLAAARAGMLSIAGLLSSLYPASTVLLARFVYDERLRLVQRVGLVLAVAGVALVTV